MAILENISNSIANSIGALLFFPLWASLIIFLNKIIPLINSKHFTLNISIALSVVNIIFSIFCLSLCLNDPNIIIENNVLWLNSDIKFFVGTVVDSFSSICLLITSLIFLFYQIFSYKFVKKNQNFHKFYMYLNFLMFAIFGLILSSNLIQSFMFVVLVSLSCYLLVSTNKKLEETQNAQKTLLINFIGDSCLLISILVFVYYSLTFNPSSNLILSAYSNFVINIDLLGSMLSSAAFIVIGLLALITIIIKLLKLTYFPLHIKNIDIYNLGSQVSIINIVLAGIILIKRLYPLLVLSNLTSYLMGTIGIISLLFIIGLFVNKEKLISCELRNTKFIQIISKIGLSISKIFAFVEEFFIKGFDELILLVVKFFNYYILKLQNKNLKSGLITTLFILILVLLSVFIFYLSGTMVEV